MLTIPGTLRAAGLMTALGGVLLLSGGCAAVKELGEVLIQTPAIPGTTPDPVPRKEPKSKYGNPPSYVVYGKRYYVLESADGFVERGIASWYGKQFHGRRTSSGETYDMYGMTAAHKRLPLPTYVEVINLQNGRRVVVRVNDRGPFHENRIIDLTYTAAEKLDILEAGTGLVEVRAIDPDSYRPGPVPEFVTVLGSALPEFFIQIGAFAELSNAENLRARVQGLGEVLVRIREADVNGRRLYRVQLGPIKSIELADRLVASLDQYGITEHRVIFE